MFSNHYIHFSSLLNVYPGAVKALGYGLVHFFEGEQKGRY